MNYKKTYIRFLQNEIDVKKPIHVVFDFSNGPVGTILPDVVKRFRRIIPHYMDARVSGNFPAHGPNPLRAPALQHIQKAVTEKGADMGVIFDADGDRAFFVDDRGRWIPPHVVASILFRGENPPYVADSRTFYALKYAGLLDAHTTRISKVGSYFIKNLMRSQRAGAGAEYSGHYYFKSFFGADSGILAAIKIMNAVSRMPYSLSGYFDLLPVGLASAEKNIRTKNAVDAIMRVRARYQNSALHIHAFDGVTLEFKDGFVNARPSNTEPVVRIFEARRKK